MAGGVSSHFFIEVSRYLAVTHATERGSGGPERFVDRPIRGSLSARHVPEVHRVFTVAGRGLPR
jgi:hypothetical protein